MRTLRTLVTVFLLVIVMAPVASAATPEPGRPATDVETRPLADPRYFTETEFRIADDRFWDFFQARGAVRTFGFPVSRKFTLLGTTVQMFQRRVMQIQADGSVGLLNLLDPDLMPYTVINKATLPAADRAITDRAPTPGTSGYVPAALNFVRENAPDTWQGQRVNFYQTFLSSVTLQEAGGDRNLQAAIALDMWGLPTSSVAADPNNANFVYLRFQRGVMHFDRTNGLTQGLLLADYFKFILTGNTLPTDLEQAARTSRFYHQYDNRLPTGVGRPNDLPGSNLKDAFEEDDTPPELGGGIVYPCGAPTTSGPLRYGMQVHMFGQPQRRIVSIVQAAGFNWHKHQIRWSQLEPVRGQIDFNSLDGVVANVNECGGRLLFSVATSPRWARTDGNTNAPPTNFADYATFVGAIAARYKGRIHAYEIWNEENFVAEWGGPTNPGQYVEMLALAYAAIKRADPAALVITGGLTPTGVGDPAIGVDDVAYLDQMYAYRNGLVKQVSDAIGAHATGYNNAPEDVVGSNSVNTPGFKNHPSFYFRRIDQLREVMVRYGDGNRQMWLTEYEWASARPPVPAGYEWTTHLTEAQAADFLARGIRITRETRPWVGAIFVWNLNFRVFLPLTDEQAIFGILNPDYSPRPLYTSLRDLPK